MRVRLLRDDKKVRKKSGLSLIASLIGKVLPEGKIENIFRKLYYDRLLTKYDIKVISKVNERIYEFGNGNIILYVDDKYALGFRKRLSKYSEKNIHVVKHKQKNVSLSYWLVKEYWWQIKDIVINEEYERWYKPKTGDIVVDAGAFVGVFTIKTAKTVGKKGLVIAIEPDSDSASYLRKNLDLNGLHNVIVVNKALWSSCGEVEYKKYIDWPAASSVAALRPNDKGDFGEKFTVGRITKVPTITIDDVVSDLCLDHVDLIKMDIEGSEIEAIKGAKDTLMKFKPKLAIAAYHKIPPEYKRSYEILAPLLKGIGYNIKTAKIGEEFFLYANAHLQEDQAT